VRQNVTEGGSQERDSFSKIDAEIAFFVQKKVECKTLKLSSATPRDVAMIFGLRGLISDEV